MKRIVVIVLLLLISVLTAAAQTSGKEMRLAANWIGAWNSHDVDKVIPLFTRDVMYEDVTFAAVNHGPAELRKFALFFFDAVPDIKFELVNSSIQGRHGSIEWLFSGTDKGVYKTGKRFSVRGVSIFTLDRDGKIARNLEFDDSATIMRQVGLLPPAETTPKE